jgi:hypothetical protein
VQIKCTKCGGVIAYPGDDQFVSCTYCECSLYVHFEGNATHYLLQPSVTTRILPAYLEKWLKAHDYAEKPRVVRIRFMYFPFWFFQTGDGTCLLPAAAVSQREILEFGLPGGDLRFFRTENCHGAEVIPPTVYASAARDRLAASHPDAGAVERVNLLHYPVYHIAYQYGGREYLAVVDGATGKVQAYERPPAEGDDRTRRFALIAAVSFIAFFVIDLLINSFWLSVPADMAAGTVIYLFARHVIEPGGVAPRDGEGAPG